MFYLQYLRGFKLRDESFQKSASKDSQAKRHNVRVSRMRRVARSRRTSLRACVQCAITISQGIARHPGPLVDQCADLAVR